MLEAHAFETLFERLRDAAEALGRRAAVMEVCGTHTHAIGRAGLRRLVCNQVRLVSGPGCPVCVTSRGDIERMLRVAARPEVTVATFGDMMRVPGRNGSLEQARATGADVRVVISPTDALQLARDRPDRQVVFLAVGFETTAPAVAAVLLQARQAGLTNFSCAVAHKLIPPAMAAVLDDGGEIDGFLTPGHVSVITGPEAYADIAAQHATPCVATGFEPEDILEGLAMVLEMLAADRYESAVQYHRAVKPGGNPRARRIMDSVFETANVDWRGLGTLPGSGLRLRPPFRSLDAYERFDVPDENVPEEPGCRCGDVLRGTLAPTECPAFGQRCTPASPLGPCMVSSEGPCAAAYRYG